MRLHVAADRTGGYTDATTRTFVNPGGDSGYSHPATHVSVAGNGHVFSSGDPVRVHVALAVLSAAFPLFPPVPKVQRVASRGSSCGTVIRLDANVLFDFGAATLRPDAGPLLTRVSTLLRALGSPAARVDGYTDHIGGTAANLVLSTQRADAVAAALRGGGVPGSRLTVRGFGESDPLCPETTPDGGRRPGRPPARPPGGDRPRRALTPARDLSRRSAVPPARSRAAPAASRSGPASRTRGRRR